MWLYECYTLDCARAAALTTGKERNFSTSECGRMYSDFQASDDNKIHKQMRYEIKCKKAASTASDPFSRYLCPACGSASGAFYTNLVRRILDG